jgi:hypothetical protein
VAVPQLGACRGRPGPETLVHAARERQGAARETRERCVLRFVRERRWISRGYRRGVCGRGGCLHARGRSGVRIRRLVRPRRTLAVRIGRPSRCERLVRPQRRSCGRFGRTSRSPRRPSSHAMGALRAVAARARELAGRGCWSDQRRRCARWGDPTPSNTVTGRPATLYTGIRLGRSRAEPRRTAPNTLPERPDAVVDTDARARARTDPGTSARVVRIPRPNDGVTTATLTESSPTLKGRGITSGSEAVTTRDAQPYEPSLNRLHCLAWPALAGPATLPHPPLRSN